MKMEMIKEELVTQILGFMPQIRQRIFHGIHVRKSMRRIQLLSAIMKEDGKPMKYYGEKLLISKPNMTKMINWLIEEGFVVRKNDSEDRRVIQIHITNEGQEYISNEKEDIKGKLMKRIEGLSMEDMQALSHHLAGIDEILEKLPNHKKGCCDDQAI